MNEDPVYTLYTLYTKRLQGGCEYEIRKTRVLSIRISRIAKQLYDLLPETDKEIVKAVAEAAVIAAAMNRFQELPCREILERRVAFALGRGPTISLNFNVNYTHVETRAEAKVNVKLSELNEIKRLLEDLLRLANANGKARRVLEQRVRRAIATLDRLAVN